MKTSELTGAALDWAVAKCETWVNDCRSERFLQIFKHQNFTGQGYCYSRDWAQGGPIIEREGIATKHDGVMWQATSKFWPIVYGPTPLIAAMRCYVASRLGDDIDVPEELIKEK